MARGKVQKPASPSPTEFDEERIPFDQVLRKLVNTKPAHKSQSEPAKATKDPPKRK